MAGDWIKMRHSLLSHPKTVRMMSALKADKFRIVGGLMSVWCLFDTHSEDGQLSGYTLETLDAMAAWDGFSAAMQAVEWLGVEDDGTLVLPRFDTHNGQSAKRRAQDSDRKREVRKVSASEADKKRTREEKRREEKEEKQEIGESPVGDPPSPADQKAKKPKREKRPDLTFDQWLATIPDDADIVPVDDPLWSWWATQRLPVEWRPLAWAAFEQKYTGKPKRYADWLAVFRSAVREDWLKVWRILPDGSTVLTTVGEQLRRSA